MRPVLAWPATLAALAAGCTMTVVGGFADQLLALHWRAGLAGVGLLLIVTGGLSVFPPTPPPPRPATAPQEPSGPFTASAATVDLFAGLRLADDVEHPGPVRTETLVDVDTGELVGDRVARLEERVDGFDRRLVGLGDVVAEQNELMTRALGKLRRAVEKVDRTFGDTDG